MTFRYFGGEDARLKLGDARSIVAARDDGSDQPVDLGAEGEVGGLARGLMLGAGSVEREQVEAVLAPRQRRAAQIVGGACAPAEDGDGEAIVAAMLDPDQFASAVDGDEAADERALEAVGAEVGDADVERLVPCADEAFGVGGVAQAIGAARGQPDVTRGGGDAAAAGERGDERALPLVALAVAALAEARDGGERNVGQRVRRAVERVGGQDGWECWLGHGLLPNKTGRPRELK